MWKSGNFSEALAGKFFRSALDFG